MVSLPHEGVGRVGSGWVGLRFCCVWRGWQRGSTASDVKFEDGHCSTV